MGILRMPIEIIRLIVENLDPDDLFHLALCGYRFRYLLSDKGICRKVLQHAKFSAEYGEAHVTGSYSRGLRRLVKRRDAVKTARPFQVLTVAKDAIHFIYANSILCYTIIQHEMARQHSLRILQLQGSVVQEVAMDIPMLLKASTISDFQEDQPYEFKPLYQANGIISCLYIQKKQRSTSKWLLVCDLQGTKIISSHSLASTNDIFVRNNEEFLYYGTRSELAGDGQKCWVLRGLSLTNGEWISQRLVLWDLCGAELGSNICFEIFDGHFYGLSSQEPVDSEETRWNSFYYAFRFRLGDHTTTQVLPKIQLWRRRATEGPVDDRWSSLELSREEASGKLFIVETRKELLSTGSQSQRTCYKKEIHFPKYDMDENDLTDDFEDPDYWDSDIHNDIRPPESLHFGDGGSSPIPFTFHDSPVRSYNASCRAFVDLVNDPPATQPTAKRLRLRVRAQVSRLCSTVDTDQSSSILPHNLEVVDAARDHEIRFWPSMHNTELPDPALDHLYGILNPQGHFDEVDWVTDDRFLVYSPKLFNHTGKPRPIILVSFDPGLRLHRLRKWPSCSNSTACCHIGAQCREALPSGKAENTVGCHLCYSTSPATMKEIEAQEERTARSTKDSLASWATIITAGYMDDKDGFTRGFDFSREVPPPVSA